MILQAVIILLAITSGFSLVAMIKTKNTIDKLIYLNLLNVKLALALTTYSVWINSQMALDISITYGLIGFLSLAIFTRFLLKGGHLK